MVISAVLFSTSALGCALSADFAQLVVYRIIGGVGIGVVSIVHRFILTEGRDIQKKTAGCFLF